MSLYVAVLLVGVLACKAPQAEAPAQPQGEAQQPTATPAPEQAPSSVPKQAQAVAATARREDRNPTVIRALEVIDSLLAHPVAPAGVGAAERGVVVEQAAWFRSLRDRLASLLSLVQTPTERAAVPAPVDSKNIKALQEEATAEAVKFTSISNVLKTRHDLAMNAIRNMK